CNGSTQAFGALRSGFESWGRSPESWGRSPEDGRRRHCRRPGRAGRPAPAGSAHHPAGRVPALQGGDRVVTHEPGDHPEQDPTREPTRVSAQPAAVIVLAAGEGTRMKSRTPKVLHRIAGRSLLGFALRAGAELEPQPLAVVVRHERDAVAAPAEGELPGVVVGDQDAIPGTGRAVQCALGVLDAKEEAGAALLSGAVGSATGRKIEGAVVVTAGDVPLLDSATLRELVAAHEADGNAVTLLSTRMEDPYGYGRVVRDENGDVVAVVEEKDATDEQRAIDEINAAVYVFDAAVLRESD